MSDKLRPCPFCGGDERLAFLEEKAKLQGDYIYKLLKEKYELITERDEWRAKAEYRIHLRGMGETCKIISSSTDYTTKWYELSCGHSMTLKGSEPPNFCPNCGKAVKQ